MFFIFCVEVLVLSAAAIQTSLSYLFFHCGSFFFFSRFFMMMMPSLGGKGKLQPGQKKTMERINAEYWIGGSQNLAPPGCFTQERGLKPEYTKKFLVCAAKKEASPSVTALGQYCFCAWLMWYLKSLSTCRPWVHLEFLVRGNTVFYSTLRTTNRRP